MKIGQRVPTLETHHRLPDTGGPNHPRSLPHDQTESLGHVQSQSARCWNCIPRVCWWVWHLNPSSRWHITLTTAAKGGTWWWWFDSWNAATELLRHQCARVILEQGLINQNCQDCTPLAVWGISPSCWLAQIQQQKKQVQKCNDNFGYLACVNHFNCRIRVIHFMENCALRAE